MGDAGASTADKNPIQLYTCDGSAAQQWTIKTDGSITALGKCLDVFNGNTTNGTQIQLYHCDGNGSQKWAFNATTRALVNPQSGRCLDATGPSSDDGTRLQIRDCTGAANQRWTLPTA